MEGMVALSDGYGLKKWQRLCVLNPVNQRLFTFPVALAGDLVKNWSKEKRVFLKCAVDQLSIAMELTANAHLPRSPSQLVSIFVNVDECGIRGLENLKDHLSEYLSN